MKEKILFECECCHAQYAAKVDAQSCENNHKRVMSVDAEKFLPEKQDASGYPIDVTLIMADGRKIRYTRR